MYYEANLKYEKISESGTPKKVSEKYLCQAICVSEVEMKVGEYVKGYLDGDFVVRSAKESNISDVVNPDTDTFYSVKYGIIEVNEKTGKEKMSQIEVLFGASGFDEAVKCFKEYSKDWVCDWELLSVSLSPILGVVK